MKYLVLNVDGEREMPFIFPKEMIHKQVFQQMARLLILQHGAKLVTPVSAGELSLAFGGFKCMGDSETLGVASRGMKDVRLFQTIDYFGGLVAPPRPAKKEVRRKGIPLDAQLTHCEGNEDGDCQDPRCPQLRDGEPAKSGRHCPLDRREGK